MRRTKHSRIWNDENEREAYVEPFYEKGLSSDAYIMNVIDITVHNDWTCIDGTFDCKRVKTAIKRFNNAINESITLEWLCKEMAECSENGTFELNLIDSNGYIWGIEQINDSVIYIFANIKKEAL